MGIKASPIKLILILITGSFILLLLLLPVHALFGKVSRYWRDDLSPQTDYYHVCYKLNGVTYNRYIPSGDWTCGDTEITDKFIRLKCGTSKGGSAFRGIFNGCDGGKSCVMTAYYPDHYFTKYKSTSQPTYNHVYNDFNFGDTEQTFNPNSTFPADPNDYGHVGSQDILYHLPMLNPIVTGTNSCPQPFMKTSNPVNGSLLTSAVDNISITTDSGAVCKYSINSEADFDNMSLFNNTNSTLHDFLVDVKDNSTYSFYIKCMDEFADIGNYNLNFFSEWSMPLINLNESLPDNLTSNTTLLLYANFSDSGSGFASNKSCEFCASTDWKCDTEWVNMTTEYSTDFSSGNCSYVWDIPSQFDYLYNISIRITDKTNNLGGVYKMIMLDRSIPVFRYLYPEDNSAFKINNNDTSNLTNSHEELTFSYTVDDASSISNCSFIFYGKINYTDYSVGKNSYKAVKLNFSTIVNQTKYYNWSLVCTDIFGYENTIGTRKFTIIVVNNFSGETTDFSLVNLSRIENLTFEQPNSGKIKFSDIVNLSDIPNINDYVKISFNRIEINSSAMPRLNKSATLYIYNLTYNHIPKISKDNITCPESICRVVNYSNGILVFNVSSFSVYTTEEAPPSSESSSGGSSGSSGGGSSGGGGGGGGGGGAAGYICNMDWKCSDWPDCVNGLQTRQCNFVKVSQNWQETPCPDESKPPITSQKCEVKAETPAAQTKLRDIHEIKQEVAKPNETSQSRNEQATGLIVQEVKEKPNNAGLITFISVSFIAALGGFFYYKFFRTRT